MESKNQHNQDQAKPTEYTSRRDHHAPDEKTINIKISLGGMPKTPASIKRVMSSRHKTAKRVRSSLITKKGLVALIAVAVLIGSIGAAAFVYQQNKPDSSTDNSSGIVENLEYQTVLPDNKSIGQLGGWRRISPPNKTPVYAYMDRIDDIAISVSEQPMPNSLETSADDQAATIAKNFNATNKLDASGVTAYIGTSAKGPQSVIFTKNGLLVLIKSQQKISDKSWTAYIKSLN